MALDWRLKYSLGVDDKLFNLDEGGNVALVQYAESKGFQIIFDQKLLQVQGAAKRVECVIDGFTCFALKPSGRESIVLSEQKAIDLAKKCLALKGGAQLVFLKVPRNDSLYA